MCIIGVAYAIIHTRVSFLGYILMIGAAVCLIGWWILTATSLLSTLAMADMCTFPNPDKFIRSNIDVTSENKVCYLITRQSQ